MTIQETADVYRWSADNPLCTNRLNANNELVTTINTDKFILTVTLLSPQKYLESYFALAVGVVNKTDEPLVINPQKIQWWTIEAKPRFIQAIPTDELITEIRGQQNWLPFFRFFQSIANRLLNKKDISQIVESHCLQNKTLSKDEKYCGMLFFDNAKYGFEAMASALLVISLGNNLIVEIPFGNARHNFDYS